MTSGRANYRTTSSGENVKIGYWWENIFSVLNENFYIYNETIGKIENTSNADWTNY